MAYPVLRTHFPSSTKTPVDGVQVDNADDGTLWARDFFSVQPYDFTLVHRGITKAEVDTLIAFYESNKGTAFSFTWKEDSTTYTCLFLGRPNAKKIDPSQDLWEAEVQLRGNP